MFATSRLPDAISRTICNPDEPPTANVFLDSTDSVNGTGEVAITGCTIQHGNRSKGCANIRIVGKTQPTKDMPLVRQGHVTITGNVLSDVQVNIHLKDCRGVTIQGNTFWEGYIAQFARYGLCQCCRRAE